MPLPSHQRQLAGVVALPRTALAWPIDSTALMTSPEDIALFSECARLHLSNEFRK